MWIDRVEISEIQPEECLWTLSYNILGTPRPINAVLVCNVRTLRWTGGVVFEEHLTAIISKRSMAWDFVLNALEVLIAVEPHVASQGDIVNI